MVKFVREAFGSLDRGDQWRYVALAIARTVISAIDLVAVLLLGVGVERLASDGADNSAFILFLAGVAMLSRSLCTLAVSRMTFRFLAKAEITIGGQFTETIFSARQESLDQFRTQELAFALSQGTNSLTTRALGFSMIAIADGLAAIALVGVFTAIYPLEGALMITSMVAILLPIQRVVNKRVQHSASRWSAATISVLNEVHEFQASRREIFLNGASKSASKQLGVNRAESAQQASRFNFMLTVPRTVIELMTLLMTALLLWVAYVRQTPSEFLVFSAILMAITFRVAPLVMGVAGSVGVVTQSQGETVINRKLLRSVKDGAETCSTRADCRESLPENEISVVLRNVSYAFPDGVDTALRDVSLEVLPHEVCAIVGPSGAGKSTLLECITGLRKVSDGSVSLFGLRPEKLRAEQPGAIGLVVQSPVMRSTSILNNVSYLVDGAPDRARVEQLLRQVGLESLLERESEGVDTLIGESHLQLSGGEKQRLGLARALYSDPRLLVLDEPTSALDGLSEENVFALLEHERLNRTIILVTHRRPPGFEFDRVFEVSDGRITSSA